jgi:hypothetical protein
MPSAPEPLQKTEPRPASSLPLFAVVVPFREQQLQNRKKQLDAFVQHMTKYLRGRRFVLIVVQQSDDGRAFNRGALLNVGFAEATRHAGAATLSSIIFHDVDLLPSPGLLKWYLEPPVTGRPTHIAAPSAWGKCTPPRTRLDASSAALASHQHLLLLLLPPQDRCVTMCVCHGEHRV